MTPNTTENHLQKNIIKLLMKLGYTYISREDNAKLRNNRFTEVILKDILLEQLQKINYFQYKGVEYKFSPKNITRAVDELNIPLNEGLLAANQKITDKLILGTSYEEELSDGNRKSFSLSYIDFDNPQNNLFYVTEEYTVNRQAGNQLEKNRRPDIVLFVNGIPFAVIELKKSSIDTIKGISQMFRNQKPDEIPTLFKYVQLVLAGNNFDPQYGTIDTPAKFYSVWENENTHNLLQLISNREPSKLDQTLYGLFEPKRFLELLQFFIIFDKRIKKVARYHQYSAIKEIMLRVKNTDANDMRAGGLIWHTQGSGKSLTMSMLTKILKYRIPNARIIVVTDRIDLDNQIHETFSNTEIKAVKANSGHDLIEKLKSGVSVITTLIHKFETVRNERVTIHDQNIFVLVDESHRTQGGGLHKAMKKVFPKGCYLGFTGTPLLAKQKRDGTLAKFGGLIHKYTLEQAIKDKAVLPLLYEGRLADQWINDQVGLDHKFELISRNLNEEQKTDLKQKWARFSNIASSERRLEMIALDINEHFRQNIQGTGFKAMLATNSKYEAIKYHEIFESLGNIKSEFVISAPDTREGSLDQDTTNKHYINQAWSNIINKYKEENKFIEAIKSEFIYGDELELLIVVDKLLTGFDAPRAAILYLDKNLKEHNLLQAIARVNRVFDGKDYGFIIDYRGLLEDLSDALTSYSVLAGFDEEDIQGVIIDIKDEIAKLKTYYSYLEDHFKSVKFKDDSESYQVYLADQKLRHNFYELLSQFGRSLKRCLSSDVCEKLLTDEDISLYKNKLKFFIELKQAIELRYHEKINFGKYEREMQKLLDSYISANQVMQITKLIDIFSENFSEGIDNIIGNNAQADAIISAMAKVIQENYEKNPAFYDKLSEKIKQIIENYKDGRLSDEEKLRHAYDVRDLIIKKREEDKQRYPNQLLNQGECAIALFDNLVEQLSFLNYDELTILIIGLDNIFRTVALKPDWQNNIDVCNQIDQNMDDILCDIEIKHNIKLADMNKLITQIRMIGINNYA